MLWAALLGFFVITLDALVVNVALPKIEHGFGGGIAGLQWVEDGYTRMFAVRHPGRWPTGSARPGRSVPGWSCS